MSEETFKAPEPEQLAELLPAYDFESFIAQGGMGAVYKAVQRSLDRDVAIKILPREFGDDPEFRRSFETEAKAMAKLNHPNLIGVYDFGDVDGMPYIVMEFVNGKSLYHSAWNQVIAPDQAVELVRAICDGLGHAHEAGIIHRDIKPANILLTPKAEPKIGDFGLAQPVDAEGDGMVMGTPGYAAPELLTQPETADHRADIFAVGVILHELITGQRPDPEGKEPMKNSPDRNLDLIWRKAVEPDPARRYQTAKEMATALAAWKPRPAPAVLATAAPPTALRTSPAPIRPPAPLSTVRRHPKSTLGRNLAIIAVLIVAIGFTWSLLQTTKNRREAEKAEAARQQAAEQAALAARREAEELRKAAAEPEPLDETPLESLARLRPALLAGRRDEMPAGSFRRGQSDYLVIEKPMSWHDAAWFAEQHGGHLAYVENEEGVTTLSQATPGDSEMWLGAGRSGGSDWVLIDGRPWQMDKTPAGVGKYATINHLGVIRARPVVESKPFVIEWRRDGSNPGALEEALARVSETLDTPAQIFPPGTFSVGGRKFSIFIRPLGRAEAERLAGIGGGLLAIPATSEEADWLQREAAGLNAPNGLWLGGEREGAIWKWRSGEAWEFARWIDGTDPGTGGDGLVLVPDRGWTNADPAQEASGFIIEWSDDAPEDGASSGLHDPGLGFDAELHAKAADLIGKAIAERNRKLEANAKNFHWDLDVWLRGLNSGDSTSWSPHVAALKELAPGERVPTPEEVAKQPKIALNPEMKKLLDYNAGKQAEIDVEYETAVRRLRDAYVARLRESADQARSSGQTAITGALDQRITNAADLNAWVASFGL